MKIENEKNVGNQVELELSFDEKEYDELYESYLKQKELKDDSKDYSFEDYMHELITLIILQEKHKANQKQLEDLKKEIEYYKGEIQAKKDGNNA